MNFVIVESPTKSRTIGKFLGKEFVVDSSFGHVRDLPKSTLGIDPSHDFAPHYVVPAKARAVVARLKKEAAKASRVILATDEDREGEAIAWHLVQALGLNSDATTSRKHANGAKDNKGTSLRVERIVFHEITERAIQEALKHPRAIDQHLVDAQQARRILDRIVGYELSPFLWQKVARGLSAGRVQSVTVRLIVERENEIRAFKPQEYWTIEALFSSEGEDARVEATLVALSGKTLEKFDIQTREDAEHIVKGVRAARFRVAKIEEKTVKRNPHPPFITSTLQQEASRRFGYSAKKTMMLAQRLYEEGHITYMRTDSVNLSREATAAAKEWLRITLGDEYAADAPRLYTTRSRLAQEAHEAVRPTRPDFAPQQHGGRADQELEKDAAKLYTLIWQRFIASQMPAARIAATSITIASLDNAFTPLGAEPLTEFTFRAAGQRIAFPGYLKIWPHKTEEKELPPLMEGSSLALLNSAPVQHFTEPLPRYSEASLIKTLEENGIGRPSTYAPTISVIQSRNYVRKEKGRFFPTEIGELVNTVLVAHFPEIVEVPFTARMEEELDKIAEGGEVWHRVVRDFYEPFEKRLEEKYAEVKKTKFEEKTSEVCDKCGKPMVIKFGRFGKFLACSGFPECKNAKPLAAEAPQRTGVKCQKCSEGELVTRRVRNGRGRGRIFWGCARYPKCDYATWKNPVPPQAGPTVETQSPTTP